MNSFKSSWLWASVEDEVHWHTTTVQVKPARDTFAEIALTRLNSIDEDNGTFGRVGIIQAVSASGVENWPDAAPPRVYRTEMTSVTFEVLVINSFAMGRWVLGYWS